MATSRRRGAAPQDERICAGKNRLVQVASAGSRKLFDAKRREVFLEWFAATCNVRLAAAKAGVAYQTVFKHRMKDEAFARDWDGALAQGYARLEARLVEAVFLPGTGRWQTEGLTEGVGSLHDAPSTIESAFDGPPPRSGEDLEPFDAQLAIAVLREQKRNVHGHRPQAQRTTARAASNKEIAEALAKRLKGFALRVSKESRHKRGPRFRGGDG